VTVNGVVVFVVGCGAAGMWYLGRTEAAVVVCFAAALLLVALGWRLFLARSWEPSLDVVPARVRRGDAVEVHACARTRRGWDRGRVHCRATLLGTDVELSIPIARAAFTRDVVSADRRGVFRSTIAHSERIGPLALAHRVIHGSPVVETTVLPRLFDFAVRTAGTDDDGPAATGPDGSVFASLREYTPGDDMRLVHWSASARTPDGTLLVRQHIAARTPEFRVILDPDLDDDDADRFEECVDIAYSLVHATPAELSTAVDGVIVTRSDRNRIDDLLLHVQPCPRHRSESAPCRAALRRATGRGGGRVTTVIVSTAGPGRTRGLPGPTIHFRVGAPERIRGRGRSAVIDVPDAAAAARAWASMVAR
jgi:uncharacterized protein (DUF58 family)